MTEERISNRWVRCVPTKDLKKEFKHDSVVMKELRRREKRAKRKK